MSSSICRAPWHCRLQGQSTGAAHHTRSAPGHDCHALAGLTIPTSPQSCPKGEGKKKTSVLLLVTACSWAYNGYLHLVSKPFSLCHSFPPPLLASELLHIFLNPVHVKPSRQLVEPIIRCPLSVGTVFSW